MTVPRTLITSKQKTKMDLKYDKIVPERNFRCPLTGNKKKKLIAQKPIDSHLINTNNIGTMQTIEFCKTKQKSKFDSVLIEKD